MRNRHRGKTHRRCRFYELAKLQNLADQIKVLDLWKITQRIYFVRKVLMVCFSEDCLDGLVVKHPCREWGTKRLNPVFPDQVILES